jgi:hypothetical protein
MAAILSSCIAGCGSSCLDMGVTVDSQGRIVVRSEDGFMSPNSALLKEPSSLPSAPLGEENFSSTQSYALSSNGKSLYLLQNTAQHPNLVYRVDLATGRSFPVGPDDAIRGASAVSDETWIASDGKYVYSVDQKNPRIARSGIADPSRLLPFITGPKTELQGPIAVAVADSGKLCATSEAALVLCYAPDARGNVAPIQSIDAKAELGYRQLSVIAFGPRDELAVAGTLDPNGVSGASVAVYDTSAHRPRLIRRIQGSTTNLRFVQGLSFDQNGGVLILQNDSNMGNARGELLRFGPNARDDVMPDVVRDPVSSLTNAFRMAVDRANGDIAFLGSNGVAYFPNVRDGWRTWPNERVVETHGWDVAFGAGRLILADNFGKPSVLPRDLSSQPLGNVANQMDLGDPDYIAVAPNGNVYTASADGTIAQLPVDGRKSLVRYTYFRYPLERNGEYFAASGSGVFYFSSRDNAVLVVGPNGAESLLRGDRTELDGPSGLAVNAQGTLFVSNSNNRTILGFSRGARGNAAPSFIISGLRTNLVAPQGLAIDASGRLYVSDAFVGPNAASGDHYVRVFAAGAHGDNAPIASFQVPSHCWNDSL